VEDLLNMLNDQKVIIDGHTIFVDRNNRLNLSSYPDYIYERLVADVAKKVIKPGNTVVDVGAHIGYFTLLFAKLVGDNGKVYAFEPNPDNFGLLRKNIEVNGYNNVVLEQKAVNSMNGYCKLYFDKIFVDENIESTDITDVECIRLDDFLKNTNVDFIKIDVEGSEYDVLKGMEHILENNKNLKIITEYSPYHLKAAGIKLEDYINTLIKYNFEIKDLHSDVMKDKLVEVYDQKIDILGNNDPLYPLTNLYCYKSVKDIGMMGIGITTYGDYQMVDSLLSSIITKTDAIKDRDYTIIVLDDGTPYPDILLELENVCKKHNVRLIENGKNRGVCYSRNKIVQSLNTDLITIFSNDITILRSDWLKNVTYFLTQNDKIGAVNFSIEQRIPTGVEIKPKCVADIGGSVFSIKKSVYNKVINPDGSIGFWESLNAFLEDTHFGFSLIKLGYYNYMLNSNSGPYMKHETTNTFNKYPELFIRSIDWSSIKIDINGSKDEFVNVIKNSRFYSDESKIENKICFSFHGVEHVNKLQLSRYMFSKYWKIEHDDELSMRHDELAKKIFGDYENPNPVKYLR
jgi:FkbM family methyltransferase